MVISSNYSLVPYSYNDRQLKPHLSANLNTQSNYNKKVFRFANTDADNSINAYNRIGIIEPFKTDNIGSLIDIYS